MPERDPAARASAQRAASMTTQVGCRSGRPGPDNAATAAVFKLAPRNERGALLLPLPRAAPPSRPPWGTKVDGEQFSAAAVGSTDMAWSGLIFLGESPTRRLPQRPQPPSSRRKRLSAANPQPRSQSRTESDNVAPTSLSVWARVTYSAALHLSCYNLPIDCSILPGQRRRPGRCIATASATVHPLVEPPYTFA